jgi:hypothetical protein
MRYFEYEYYDGAEHKEKFLIIECTDEQAEKLIGEQKDILFDNFYYECYCLEIKIVHTGIKEIQDENDIRSVNSKYGPPIYSYTDVYEYEEEDYSF